MTTLALVQQQLEELGFTQTTEQLNQLLEGAEKEPQSHLLFLKSLIDNERQARHRRNLLVRTKLAHLPYRKNLQEFDFSFQPGLDKRLIMDLASMAFVERSENVIFLGPPGVGKSHLAVALAIEAITQGISVYFVSLSYLIEDLRKAYHDNRLEKRLRVYVRPKILIIDEVGYLPLDKLAGNILFQVISSRYERGSIILTSNKGFSEWGELLGDPILATAMLDRLVHHCHIINIRGNSYRLKDKLQNQTPKVEPAESVGQI